MSLTVEAIYEDDVLKLAQPLNLADSRGIRHHRPRANANFWILANRTAL